MKCPYCDLYEYNHDDPARAARIVAIHISKAHPHIPSGNAQRRAAKAARENQIQVRGIRTPQGGWPKTCGLQPVPPTGSTPWRAFKLRGSL